MTLELIRCSLPVDETA